MVDNTLQGRQHVQGFVTGTVILDLPLCVEQHLDRHAEGAWTARILKVGSRPAPAIMHTSDGSATTIAMSRRDTCRV